MYTGSAVWRGAWTPTGRISGSAAFLLAMLRVPGQASTSQHPAPFPAQQHICHRGSAVAASCSSCYRAEQDPSRLGAGKGARAEEERKKCIQRKERNSIVSNAKRLWNTRGAGALTNTALPGKRAKAQSQRLLDAGDTSVGIWFSRAASSNRAKLLWIRQEAVGEVLNHLVNKLGEQEPVLPSAPQNPHTGAAHGAAGPTVRCETPGTALTPARPSGRREDGEATASLAMPAKAAKCTRWQQTLGLHVCKKPSRHAAAKSHIQIWSRQIGFISLYNTEPFPFLSPSIFHLAFELLSVVNNMEQD